MLSASLITMMVVLYAMQSFLCKKYADSYPGESGIASIVFTAVSGFIVAAVSLCFMGFKFDAGWMTLLLGTLNALVLFGYNYFLVNASNKGPFTLVMVCAIAGSEIIPGAVAAIGFGEQISAIKWGGIALLIAGVYLSAKSRSDDQGGAIDFKSFIPACLILAICNGSYGSLTDVQQRLTGPAEREEMIFYTYVIASFIASVYVLIRNRGSVAPFKQTKKSFTYLLICSVIVGLAINLLVIIIPMLNDIATLHTVNNSGILILTAILSAVFLGERPAKINYVGYGVVCIASVIVALF